MPRVNRTAAARRQQYARANAKVTQVLLRNFQALQHRGCQTSKLGHALIAALSHNEELAFTPSDDPAVISWATAAEPEVTPSKPVLDDNTYMTAFGPVRKDAYKKQMGRK